MPCTLMSKTQRQSSTGEAMNPPAVLYRLRHQRFERGGIAHIAGRRGDGRALALQALRDEAEARLVDIGQE